LFAGERALKHVLRNSRGLSTVVTTLIILVVSVLLATVVTFYAVNVTTTRVQEESLQISKQHIWHDGQNFSEATFVIVNTGGRDVVIDKINVRGQECSWGNIFYNKSQNVINNDLQYNSTLSDWGTITVGTNTYTFRNGIDDLILKSGWTMIVYISNPDHVSVNDIGTTIGITVFTANAQYYKEGNVEAAT